MRLVAAALLSAAMTVTAARSYQDGADTEVGWNTLPVSNYQVLQRGKFNGTLYTMQIPGAKYNASHMPSVVDLHGTRYEQGYDYGYLTAVAAKQNMAALYQAIFKVKEAWLVDIITDVFNLFLDWQWNDWLSKQVPSGFIEEMQGFTDGGAVVGIDKAGQILARGTTLANFPGTISDLMYVLADEFNLPAPKEAFDATSPAHAVAQAQLRAGVDLALFQHPVGKAMALRLADAGIFDSPLDWLMAQHSAIGMQCSMMGMWGSRTPDGRVFSGRNLDWLSNSGMNANKYVVVWRPPNGTAHATVGFAGLHGALTGMSAAGLTVHEANLEEKQETFRGFPWMLRLRWIMEHAASLADAKSMWEASNNTVGFNHGVASAADAKMLIMETEADYTAYFGANDPREADAMYNTSSGLVHAGFPLTDAVWRTNHGYDPKIRADFLWSQGPNTDSQNRYNIIHDQIVAYEQAGVPIGPLQAINVTSLPGDKGADFYHCGDTHKGTNVVSVAYDPAHGNMFAAWEAYSGAAWRPAACGTYVQMNMTAWFAGSGPVSGGVSLL